MARASAMSTESLLRFDDEGTANRPNAVRRRPKSRVATIHRTADRSNGATSSNLIVATTLIDDFGDNIPVQPKELEVIETYLGDLLDREICNQD
jgi:hypothetical protein